MFDRKWKKIIIFCLLFTLIFVTTITLHIILPKQSALAIKEQEWEMLLEQKDFIQAVNKVEQHWEKDYENYFDKNLADFSLTGEEIGETLKNLSQKTNTKPAVIWTWQRERQMQIILITPGQKPEMYTVTDLAKEKLIKTARNLNVEITIPRNRNTISYLEPAQKLYKWIVKPSDIGTLALMTEFYQHFQKMPLKAEALRQAQIAMLKGQVDINMGELNGSWGELQLPSELS